MVDFGEDVKGAMKNRSATHALVLIFRPYKGSWVQPFACFASRNAASFPILYEIIVNVLLRKKKPSFLLNRKTFERISI